MSEPSREATALALLNEVARVATEGVALRPLLQRICERLVEAFDWDHAGFALVDHEAHRIVVEAVASRIDHEIRVGDWRPIGSGLVGLVAASGRPIAIDDVASHPEYVPVAKGVRTEVCLPVRGGGQTVAVLNFEDRRVRDLAAEFPLLEAVARQIEVAIANARLQEEVVRRGEQFDLVSELMHAALDAEELEPVLGQVVDRLRRRFDFLMVSVYLLDPFTSKLELKGLATRVPVPQSPLPSLSIGRGIVGRALQLQRAQLVVDVRSDPSYVPLFAETRSELAIPILFRGRSLGVFNFENDGPQIFNQETVSLLQLLCDQLAGVVHLSSLNRKLSETTDELEQSNRRLSEMNRALVELSTVDSLTGLANRRQFDRVLDLEWRRAVRATAPLALLLVDIDFFKRYNDTYGHLRGDAALAEVAKAIAGSFSRAGDVVARYGGEEFAALLPATGAEAALELAEQARVRVEARGIPHAGSESGRPLTVSLGVVSLVPDGQSPPSSLIEAADRALYEAKASGRNCIRIAGL
jgi:diguanylate cyclase (GGDEF)-like protein